MARGGPTHIRDVRNQNRMGFDDRRSARHPGIAERQHQLLYRRSRGYDCGIASGRRHCHYRHHAQPDPWKPPRSQRTFASLQTYEGKKIGVANFGGGTELAVILALKKWKIPLEAVSLLQSGGSSDRLTAVMKGGIDASPLAPPQSFEAAQRGLNV